MSPPSPFPIRKECPPGACVCDRDALLSDPLADIRILRLTTEEEKKLIAHIDGIATYADLGRLQERMQAHLGVVLQITPSTREVRSARGIGVQIVASPGLCRKTRQAIPAAVRRCLEKNPAIVYAILDAHDLFGAG